MFDVPSRHPWIFSFQQYWGFPRERLVCSLTRSWRFRRHYWQHVLFSLSSEAVCHNLRKKRTSVHSTCGLIIKSHNLPEHSNNSGDSQQSGCILQCERWYYSLHSRHQFCYFFFLGRAWGRGDHLPFPPLALCVLTFPGLFPPRNSLFLIESDSLTSRHIKNPYY